MWKYLLPAVILGCSTPTVVGQRISGNYIEQWIDEDGDSKADYKRISIYDGEKLTEIDREEI